MRLYKDINACLLYAQLLGENETRVNGTKNSGNSSSLSPHFQQSLRHWSATTCSAVMAFFLKCPFFSVGLQAAYTRMTSAWKVLAM